MFKLLSVVPVIISCLSLAMNANPNKTYEVFFKSINQLQITTVGSIKIALAELILSIFFILSIILFQNVSKYHLRLEVINDLIKEYEDQIKKEEEYKDELVAFKKKYLSDLITKLQTTQQNMNDDIQEEIDSFKKDLKELDNT